MTANHHAAAVYTVEGLKHTADTLAAAITAADADGADRITVTARHSVSTPHSDHTLIFPRRNLVHGTMDGWTLDGQEYAGWEATIDDAAAQLAAILTAEHDGTTEPPTVAQDDTAELTALAVGLPLYPAWGSWVNVDDISRLIVTAAGNQYAVLAETRHTGSDDQPVRWALTPPIDNHDDALAAMNDIARQLATGTDWPDHPTPRKL